MNERKEYQTTNCKLTRKAMYPMAPIHFLLPPELDPAAVVLGPEPLGVPGGGSVAGGGGGPIPRSLQSDPR